MSSQDTSKDFAPFIKEAPRGNPDTRFAPTARNSRSYQEYVKTGICGCCYGREPDYDYYALAAGPALDLAGGPVVTAGFYDPGNGANLGAPGQLAAQIGPAVVDDGGFDSFFSMPVGVPVPGSLPEQGPFGSQTQIVMLCDITALESDDRMTVLRTRKLFERENERLFNLCRSHLAILLRVKFEFSIADRSVCANKLLKTEKLLSTAKKQYDKASKDDQEAANMGVTNEEANEIEARFSTISTKRLKKENRMFNCQSYLLQQRTGEYNDRLRFLFQNMSTIKKKLWCLRYGLYKTAITTCVKDLESETAYPNIPSAQPVIAYNVMAHVRDSFD